MAGAGLAFGGPEILEREGLTRILEGLVFSPIFGFLLAYMGMLAIYWSLRKVTPARITAIFSKLQILTAGWMAFSHGSNDAQKTMGIITLALFTHGSISVLDVPLWVIILSGAVMAAGTYFGGYRVIRTLGARIVTMRPVHGAAAEGAAAGVITVASRLGVPISTTHVITSAILGMGSTRRLSAVRWGVARGIVYAWILTFPVCAVLGAVSYYLADLVTV